MLFILLINWEISWNHLFISNDTVQATAYADTEWVVNPALLPPETKSVALTLRVKLVQLLRFGMVRIGKYAPCATVERLGTIFHIPVADEVEKVKIVGAPEDCEFTSLLMVGYSAENASCPNKKNRCRGENTYERLITL